jgi:hypothetical protein
MMVPLGQDQQAEHDDARIGADHARRLPAASFADAAAALQIDRLRQAGAQPQPERQAAAPSRKAMRQP